MRILVPAFALLASCYPEDWHGITTDTDADADTDTDTDADSDADTDTVPPPTGDLTYVIELTKTGKMTDLVAPRMSMVSNTNNYVYVQEAASSAPDALLVVHYLMSSYLYPTGDDDTVDDYCVDGEMDGDICRGKLWTAGRVESQKPTKHMCLDQVSGRLFMVKDQGTKLEIADTAIEGEEPYSYNFAAWKIDYASSITSLGRFLGRCEYLPYRDEVLLTGDGADTEATTGFARVNATDATGELVQYADLGMIPEYIYAVGDGHEVVLNDTVSSSLVVLDTESLTELRSWPASDLVHFGMNRTTGIAYLAKGEGGASMLDTTDAAAVEIPIKGITTSTVRWAFADATHDNAWFVGSDDGSHFTVFLVRNGVVVSSMEVSGDPVVDVAEPGDMGDLVVIQQAGSGSGAWQIFGARANKNDGRPPVKVFLFTTIEEPSDANLDESCTEFDDELELVRANASRLAALRTAAGNPVPIAMAITDNFGEKAELCGVAEEIYNYLDNELGFELGAMLHNRPCYNCSSGDSTPDADGLYSNPDYCGAEDANYIASGNTGACFPDDPEYCPLGDWDCYTTFLAPRLDFADKWIPGGAKFIVGADRHGMWEYDWIRLYQEVDRPSQGLTGFDTTMFVGDWAYNNIDYDDPRGKNPATWRPQDRSAAWRPGDIDNWTRDSAYSRLLYLPGINSATNKIGEQQRSSLYMEDYFDYASNIHYEITDFDVQWQFLRQAVNYRQRGHVNTWNWHIHDNGVDNLVGGQGSDFEVELPDGTTVTVAEQLQRFVDQIDARYVATGEVEWAYPSEIRAEYEECCAW